MARLSKKSVAVIKRADPPRRLPWPDCAGGKETVETPVLKTGGWIGVYGLKAIYPGMLRRSYVER